MLRAVHAVAPQLGLRPEVAHCNFHLRDAESDRDMHFVQQLCTNLELPLHLQHFDVPAYCTAHKVSVEQACRELRYRWFETLQAELGCARIVVAHNADDNVETLMLNLLRGSGIAGLCAMTEDDGLLLRPLLSISRSEILQYLQDLGQNYVTDSTNMQNNYRRNFLRNRVLPLLQEQWPGARRAIGTTIRNLQSQLPIFNAGMQAVLQDVQPDFLPICLMTKKPQARAIIHTFLQAKGPIPPTMIDEITDVANSGRIEAQQWNIPAGVLYMRRDGLYFQSRDARHRLQSEISRSIIPNSKKTMELIRTDRDLRHAYFPASLPAYIFRTARPEDRMQPLGMKCSQSVRKILKDAGIPAVKRTSVQVMQLVDDGTILWIPGVKRSARYLVSETDDEILSIRTAT